LKDGSNLTWLVIKPSLMIFLWNHCPFRSDFPLSCLILGGYKKTCVVFFLNKWDFTSSKQWDMRDVKNIWFSITRYDL
jgi:hypothetical protein